MKHPRVLLLFPLVLLTFCFGLSLPVAASPQLPQAYYQTPTAGADGRIVYIVKDGDSCTRISLLTGVSQEQLKLLNDLKGDCAIKVGQKLLLGVLIQPTVIPTLTATLPALPQTGGSGSLCVFLFEDMNGNSRADDTEKPLAGGAISVADRAGKFSKTMTTDASGSPTCQKDVPEGEYNVSIAVPNNYNSTTVTNYVVMLKAGDETVVDFGAQVKGTASTPSPAAADRGGASILIAVLGGALVLAGMGLGIYVWRMNRAVS
jgi:LysM repeat protein